MGMGCRSRSRSFCCVCVLYLEEEGDDRMAEGTPTTSLVPRPCWMQLLMLQSPFCESVQVHCSMKSSPFCRLDEWSQLMEIIQMCQAGM